MDTIEHQGYRGSVRFSSEDRVFHGQIIGINDVITFEATTVAALEKSFRRAVKDYIEACEEIGKTPERTYSGKIPLRIDQELHRRIAAEAEAAGSSLNGWIAEVLGSHTRRA